MDIKIILDTSAYAWFKRMDVETVETIVQAELIRIKRLPGSKFSSDDCCI
ncbi:MAG: hypothetical protein AB1Z29_28140 [Desulfobacterales bacterium]|jgi:hypothetical protein